MSKKKFKDTRLAQFLKGKGSHIADFVGDVLPSEGLLGVLKNVIDKDNTLPPQAKEEALKLLEMDMVEMQEVTKRWEADLNSDNKLSKNVRPLTLMFMTVSLILFIFLDSVFDDFNFDEIHIETLKQLCSVVFIAYFGGRSYEKIKKR